MADATYEYEYDPIYCYAGSHVLVNKLNVRDADAILAAERNITALRILELKQSHPKGELNFPYYKRIHGYLFQDIYDWAGQIRTVNISKGSQFCLAAFIEEQANELFLKLKRENYLAGSNHVAERLAFYLSELNAIHPFREGNGRCQRMYIEILAERAGYEVDFSEVTSETMIEASRESFNGAYGKMTALFQQITTRIERNTSQQRNSKRETAIDKQQETSSN